ncbi:hypothetical protein Zm00014a_027630 [Zea mays]|jgi:hypothetical protein|uniref:Uncharacterized protein n=2 Tax=Zea mays TaxID=4577 RepID=A0A3L6EHE4_MAIZE|nr:uncharacterized protein LOC100276097 precursor [Zea mays]PWZ20474.1 hypothetical protein Zm00014a_027630 [Zea mays]
MTTSPRVWLLAMALALACVLLVRSADAAAEASPTPGGSTYGCNPATDKSCKPEGVGVVLPGGGIDLDGDGDEDELPQFQPHLMILGHGH